MKKTLLLFISALVFQIANAQFKAIAEGPTFKEPEEGFAKILYSAAVGNCLNCSGEKLRIKLLVQIKTQLHSWHWLITDDPTWLKTFASHIGYNLIGACPALKPITAFSEEQDFIF